MQYSFRENKKEQRSFELKSDAIVVTSQKKGVTNIPFFDIRSVALMSPQNDVFLTRITRKDGRKVLIGNRSFVSWGKFQNQNTQYKAFVTELHSRLSGQPQITFRAGSSLLFFLSLFGLVIIVAVAALFIGLYVMYPEKNIRPLRLAPMLIALPFCIYQIKKGRGQTYKPSIIPKNFMPSDPSPS